MKKILSNFKGRVPRLGAKILDDNQAQVAINVDLRSGYIKGFKTMLQGAAQTVDTISMHPIDTEIFTSTLDCNFVKHDVSGTPVLIVSDGTAYPKQYTDALYPSDHRRLGVVAPSDTLTMTFGTIGAVTSTEINKTVSYIYTYVTSWGEESAPSPATPAVDVQDNQYVTLTNFDTPSAANKNDVTAIRIYRLETGTRAADFQFLEEVDDQTTTYDDYNVNIGLNEVQEDIIATASYSQPPDTLAGILRYANGVLAGFSGADLYLSEPFIVYAWPESYILTFDSDIVAIAAFNDAIIVMTETKPYIVSGTSPDTMMVTPVNIDQKCIAKRGVVETNIGVVYPSPDGLILVDGASATTISKNVITKEQWQALTPADLLSYWYDDMLVCFFEGTDLGFIIIDGTWVDLDIAGGEVKGGYVDPADDTLKLIVDRTTFYVETFNAHATNYLAWEYHCKIFDLPFPTAFSCAKVYGTLTGGVGFTIYYDEISTQYVSVLTQLMFRLPAASRYYDWYIKLTGVTGTNQTIIESVALATTPAQLMHEVT